MDVSAPESMKKLTPMFMCITASPKSGFIPTPRAPQSTRRFLTHGRPSHPPTLARPPSSGEARVLLKAHRALDLDASLLTMGREVPKRGRRLRSKLSGGEKNVNGGKAGPGKEGNKRKKEPQGAP